MLHRVLQSVPFAFVLALTLPGVQAAEAVGSVVAVQPTRVADLVMLDAGLAAGLRQGMICRLERTYGEDVVERAYKEL